MNIVDFLSLSRTQCGVSAVSKKRTLELVANLIADDVPSLKAEDIFMSLVNREKLGSTGIGGGIAIPHCRMDACLQTTGALIKLDKSIDFEAIDDHPVDLVFVLLAPGVANDEHLNTLKSLAEKLIDPNYVSALRRAKTNEELYAIAVS